MSKKTFEERCKFAQACLPDTLYRAMLAALHKDMLAKLAEQQAVDIAALVEGMEVSVDVSTGDHNSGRRLFGSVTLAQENEGSKHGLILLVQDPEANFKHHPQAQPACEWVEIEAVKWDGDRLIARLKEKTT